MDPEDTRAIHVDGIPLAPQVVRRDGDSYLRDEARGEIGHGGNLGAPVHIPDPAYLPPTVTNWDPDWGAPSLYGDDLDREAGACIGLHFSDEGLGPRYTGPGGAWSAEGLLESGKKGLGVIAYRRVMPDPSMPRFLDGAVAVCFVEENTGGLPPMELRGSVHWPSAVPAPPRRRWQGPPCWNGSLPAPHGPQGLHRVHSPPHGPLAAVYPGKREGPRRGPGPCRVDRARARC